MNADAVREWAQGLGNEGITWLGLAAIILLWLVWSLAKKVVRAGYFLLAYIVGSGVAYGVAAATGNEAKPEAVLAAGLSFAFLWTSIRAKIARTITALTVGAILSLGAHQGWDKILPGVAPSPEAKKGAARPVDARANGGRSVPRPAPGSPRAGSPRSAPPAPRSSAPR